MQTFLVQPATGSLTGKYPSRTCVHPTCVALIIHLEIPDVSRNSWHNHQSTQGCAKLCLTLTQCSTAELLGASPSAAWCCSGLGSSATTAGRGCAPALCDFLPFPLLQGSSAWGWAKGDTGLSPEPGSRCCCRAGVMSPGKWPLLSLTSSHRLRALNVNSLSLLK